MTLEESWKDHEAAPIEFMHGRMLDLFHDYRRSKDKDDIYVKMSGKEFNDILVKAKNETYEKYPKQVSSNAILKSDL